VSFFDYLKDMFVSTSPSKDLRNANTVKNAKAIKEDRWAALQYFDGHPDMKTAVEALLPRFEYSLEHGILDTREKELVMKQIVAYGKDAVPIVQDFLKKTSRIAWPIKIIKTLSDDATVADGLFAALNFSDTMFDESQIDKNYDILCHLIDYKIGSRWNKLTHFINDPDERVRFAVIELLMEQPFEEVSDIFEKVMLDQSPDNSRVKQTVVNKYLERKWKIKTPQNFPNGQVVGPVFVAKDFTLELRS